jgi:hypothetical protein
VFAQEGGCLGAGEGEWADHCGGGEHVLDVGERTPVLDAAAGQDQPAVGLEEGVQDRDDLGAADRVDLVEAVQDGQQPALGDQCACGVGRSSAHWLRAPRR